MAQKKNIIVGAANVWVAPADADDPTGDALYVKANSMGTVLAGVDDWRNVGYTMDGVTVSYEPTFADVEVDQSLDSARTFKTSMRVTMATTLTEGTLENLAMAWGQADPAARVDAGDTTTGVQQEMDIEQGGLGEAPLERQLIAIGNGLEGTLGYHERTYYVQRAIQTDTSTHSLRRAEATTFPVSFRILPGDDGAPYGTITDRARQAGWA